MADRGHEDKRRGLPDPNAPIVQKVFNEPSGSLVLVLGQSTLAVPRIHRLYVRTIDDDLYREVSGLGDRITINEVIPSAKKPEIYVNVWIPVEEEPIGTGYDWKAVFVVPLPQGTPREVPIVLPSASPGSQVWISELKRLQNEVLLVKFAKQRPATAEEIARMEGETSPPRRIFNAQTVDYYWGHLNPGSGILTEIQKLDSPFAEP